MKLQVQEARFQNIRDFQDLTLDLGGGSGRHISLFQMPNGTGKTTTMKLLRAALSGDLAADERPRDFRPTLFSAVSGTFQLKLTIDDRPMTIILKLDYEADSYEFYTAAVSKGGKNPGHRLPLSAQHLLRRSFCELFVFDGELAKQLLNRNQTRAEDAIRAIYRLDLLSTDLSERIDEAVDKKRESTVGTGVQTGQGLTRLENERKRLSHLLKDLEREKDDATQEVDRCDRELKDVEAEFDSLIKENEKVAARKGELDGDLKTAKHQIKAASKDLMAAIAMPHRFSPSAYDRMHRLAQNMNALKLPKDTASEFFRTLAHQERCVCGKRITTGMREHILATSQKYLGEDRVRVMNRLKSKILDLPDHEGCEALARAVRETVAKAERLRQERNHLVDTLSDEDQNRAEALRERRDELREVRKDQEIRLNGLTVADPSIQNRWGATEEDNIPRCEAKIAELDNQIDTAKGTVDFRKKAEILRAMTKAIVTRSVDRIKQRVQQTTNRELERIHGAAKLVRIEKIDRAIYLEGKEDVSEGQKLSLAYCFLSTLLGESPIEVPFIVDSPAGSLDHHVRREVGAQVPGLFKQMVIFVISTERDGFITSIQKRFDDITYTTIHKNRDDPIKVEVNSDRAYFEDFQADDEEQLA